MHLRIDASLRITCSHLSRSFSGTSYHSSVVKVLTDAPWPMPFDIGILTVCARSQQFLVVTDLLRLRDPC
jgi:hypothetical protein